MAKKIPSELAFTLRGRGQHAWPYVYAHRDAEELLDSLNAGVTREETIPPDLVSANLPLGGFENGVYGCTVLDQPATLFLWRPGDDMRQGLVLLDSDAEGIAQTRARLEMS